MGKDGHSGEQGGGARAMETLPVRQLGTGIEAPRSQVGQSAERRRQFGADERSPRQFGDPPVR